MRQRGDIPAEILIEAAKRNPNASVPTRCHRCGSEGDHGDSWMNCVHMSYVSGANDQEKKTAKRCIQIAMANADYVQPVD